MDKSPIVKRVVAAVPGGIPELARILGITRHAIYQWDHIPIARVIDIERVTGIPRAEICPEFYTPDAAE